ncbi:MAG: acyltransferase family protein [Candidatus Dormiibacterota bacterium]
METRGRIYWVDALKAVIVVGICLFHASLVFSPGSWLVNNAERSLVLGGFAAFTFQWGIALMFILAGAASWFGLRSRGVWHFASSRVIRLGLPLAAGIAVLSPLQSYLEHTRTIEVGGLLRTYVTFWTSVHITWSPASAYGLVFHLWFLTHLLAISLVTLPIAVWLRSGRGRNLIEGIVRSAGAPGAYLMGALPLAAVQMALHARFPAYQDWSDLAAWSVLYLCGFVLMSDARFEAALRRHIANALVVALLVSATIGFLSLTGRVSEWDAHPDYSAGYLAYQALRSLNTWSWLVFLLGIGVRWLDRYNRLAEWGADMPMPFYVLHQPVLVVIARFVVGWNAGLWLKFFLIVSTAIGVTLVLCEGVRRVRVLRVLFGLRGVAKPRLPRGPNVPDGARLTAL